MDTLMAYLMLSLFVLAFVGFALGTATRLSSWTGGHKRTNSWSMIFTGIGFLSLAASGLLSLPYLAGWMRIFAPLSALFLGAAGYFILRLGIAARKATLKSSGPK